MAKARRSPGLTFIELLMAIAIFSLIAVGLSAHLRGAMTVWRRGHEATDQAQRARVLCLRLSQDLANAVIVDLQPAAVPKTEFSTEKLAFLTVSPSRHRLEFVTYELDHDGGKSALIRQSQTYQEAKTGRGSPRHTVLVPSVKSFDIRYAFPKEQADGWEFRRGDWPSSSTLPRLVEVAVTQTIPQEGEPATEPLALTAIFPIPTGMLEANATSSAPQR